MGCIHVTRDTFEEVRAGTSKNFSHLYRTTECSHVSRLDILMTTKDFKGRCYMRGHPRICLNMLGTHLMAVPNICQKKKTPCILWVDILGVDILGRTRYSAQAVEGMQVQK